MMEFYLCRGAEKNVEMECEIPETWIDWVAHRSEQVSIHCGPLMDSKVEKELNVKEAKPLLKELTSLLASSYNVEKYSYLATCDQLPTNQAVRDRLINQAIERKLARNPNYSATKSLVRILEKQQMQGGVLLVARD